LGGLAARDEGARIIASPAKRAYLEMFPRLLGYAEIGWSPRDGRNWEEYSARLAQHGARLDAHRVAFYRSPLIDWPP
jgi:hexosaminidase